LHKTKSPSSTAGRAEDSSQITKVNLYFALVASSRAPQSEEWNNRKQTVGILAGRLPSQSRQRPLCKIFWRYITDMVCAYGEHDHQLESSSAVPPSSVLTDESSM
jgi:hypothetical protein